jgi:hypothetical protein
LCSLAGWTPDFIPQITENAMDMNLVDELLPIEPANVGGASFGSPVLLTAMTSELVFSRSPNIFAMAHPTAAMRCEDLGGRVAG